MSRARPPEVPSLEPVILVNQAWQAQTELEPPLQPEVYRQLVGMGFEEQTATPDNEHFRKVMKEEQFPLLRAPTHGPRVDLGGPVEATELVTAKATELGADLASTCRVDLDHVYHDRQDAVHTFGIVLALAMDYDNLSAAPHQPAGEEVTRGYMELGWVCIKLARWLREQGWEASAHHPRGDRWGECDLLYVPHAIAAGMGELGRHGSLMTPEFGPRLRLGMVTTELPLEQPEPAELGFENFCVHCTRCADTCPAQAIPLKKSPRRGSERYLVDTEACLPYFAAYDGCGVCLNECVLNLPGVDLNLELARKISTRYGLARWWQVTHPHHQELLRAELAKLKEQT